MTIIHSPHDNFFKEALANTRVAKEFFQRHLPVPVQKYLDFNSLELQQGNYIEKNLKHIASDVLYKINYINQQNSAYLYVLAEHQSSVDKLMPFRLWQYIIAIWSECLKKQKSKQDKHANKLPLVIPIVFYNGSQQYNGPLSLAELIAAPSELITQFLFAPFNLVDVHTIADEDLSEKYWVGLMEYLMKHIYDREALNLIGQLSWFIRQIEHAGGTNYIISALHYLLGSAETKDPSQVLEALKSELSDEGGVMIMSSVVEYLTRQNKDLWLQEGLQQGESALLTRQLERKFKSLPDKYRKKIKEANSDTLLMWGEKILDSQSLEEVFRS